MAIGIAIGAAFPKPGEALSFRRARSMASGFKTVMGPAVPGVNRD